MKLNQWTVCLAIVGAVGLMPAARAQQVVDNIYGYPDTENFSSVGYGNVYDFGSFKAQLFTAGVGGTIGSLELTLVANGNQSATLPVYIFDLSDNSTSAEIGTISGITGGVNNYFVNLNSAYVENDPLSAGDQYRIAVDVSGAGTSGDLYNVGWVASTIASPAATGTGPYSIPDEFENGSGENVATATWTPASSGASERFLDLEAVPEPSTLSLLIFAPLAWLVGRAGRWGWRHFKPAA